METKTTAIILLMISGFIMKNKTKRLLKDKFIIKEEN